MPSDCTYCDERDTATHVVMLAGPDGILTMLACPSHLDDLIEEMHQAVPDGDLLFVDTMRPEDVLGRHRA